jgi:multisubunit Na+/H+ antiporter MnhE subunit
MKAWTRFEDWTNLVLGAYLSAVPFLFGMTGEAASSWNAFVVGAVVAVVSVWVLAAPASKAAEWINLVISFAAAALGRMSRTHGRTQDQS